MNKLNRIDIYKNSKKNIIAETINRFIKLFLPFLLRIVIIKKIGIEYVGINSLFANIFRILSLTDLGINNAIVFLMYKPIAENNKKRICALLGFYRRVYLIIGTVTLIMGLSILPFIDMFIKSGIPSEINIYYVYLIYLVNTVIGYFFFGYKESLLIAHQENSVSSNCSSLVFTIMYIMQILIIIVTKNYYIYAVALPISMFILNFLKYYSATKMYPEYKCEYDLEKAEKAEIWEKLKGLFIDKACGLSRNSFDSVAISMFVGLSVVGMYNNYFYVLDTVAGMVLTIVNSIKAGIGNEILVKSEEENYSRFNRLNLLYMFIASICTCCLSCLYQPFIELFFGKECLLNKSTVILLCVYFFLLKVPEIRDLYYDAKGIWWENRKYKIVETITNIVLNFILGYFYGLDGIIGATIIGLVIINIVFGSKNLFIIYFKNQNLKDYYIGISKNVLLTTFACVLCCIVCSLTPVEHLYKMIIRGLVCIVIPSIIFYISYREKDIFKGTVEDICKIIKEKNG